MTTEAGEVIGGTGGAGASCFRLSVARLGLLAAICGLGMGIVFLLPRSQKFQPLGLKLELPQFVGEWYGRELEVGAKEIETLGRGTDFSRKLYTNGRGDEVMASIVLSGQDMNVSIHRPERCLPAQGWTVVDSRPDSIMMPGADGRLPVTRLHNVRAIPVAGGEAVKLYSIDYYWFTGYDVVSASHFERNWIDVRDRFGKGYNQRWAYVMIAANVTKTPAFKFGRDDKETDGLLKDFIARLVPMIHLDTVKYR